MSKAMIAMRFEAVRGLYNEYSVFTPSGDSSFLILSSVPDLQGLAFASAQELANFLAFNTYKQETFH